MRLDSNLADSAGVAGPAETRGARSPRRGGTPRLLGACRSCAGLDLINVIPIDRTIPYICGVTVHDSGVPTCHFLGDVCISSPSLFLPLVLNEVVSDRSNTPPRIGDKFSRFAHLPPADRYPIQGKQGAEVRRSTPCPVGAESEDAGLPRARILELDDTQGFEIPHSISSRLPMPRLQYLLNRFYC